MSVKIPSNFLERPQIYGREKPAHREFINVEVLNYTTEDLFIKRSSYNTICQPLTIMDEPRCCVEVIVTYSFNFENIPSFFEPETPLDLYIMFKIREAYRNKSEEELIAFGGQINGRLVIGISRTNLGEYVGSDGGVHSRLLSMSFYPFQKLEKDFVKIPSPFYSGITVDPSGNRVDRNSPTQVLYEYVNNTNPDAVIYTPVNGQVLKLVPKQDPNQEDGLKLTVTSILGMKEIFSPIPDPVVNREKFFKALEDNNLYLSSSEALESINSKSLQQATSMVSSLQTKVKALEKETLTLREAHGKLKETNSKQQLKHEQTSVWSKLFESVIKVPFNIIGHLLEAKLTQVLAPKLMSAIL